MEKWISINEQRPRFNQEVSFVDKNGKTHIGHYTGFMSFEDEDLIKHFNVKQWKPKPAKD